MTSTASPVLARTRDSWHRLAEHVLAAGQFAAAGTIRLRPCPGGFSTVVGVHDRDLAVVGDELVVTEGGARRSAPLTTIRAAAEFAGVQPGLRGSYSPATPADPELPLSVDAAAARVLADWYALGDTALRRLADEAGGSVEPVLWPEHLDLAIAVEEVNYGASPGDDALPGPYLYVGPHEGPTSRAEFWNTPFGAAVPAGRIATPDDAVAFFSAGRARVLTDRSRT